MTRFIPVSVASKAKQRKPTHFLHPTAVCSVIQTRDTTTNYKYKYRAKYTFKYKAMVEKAKPSWKEMSYAAPPCIPAWCVLKQCTWNLTATQVFSYFQDFAAPYEYSCFLFQVSFLAGEEQEKEKDEEEEEEKEGEGTNKFPSTNLLHFPITGRPLG